MPFEIGEFCCIAGGERHIPLAAYRWEDDIAFDNVSSVCKQYHQIRKASAKSTNCVLQLDEACCPRFYP